MKKLFVLILIVFLVIFNACDGVYEEAELTKTNDYKQMWNFYGNRSLMKLFPKTIDNLNVMQFDCRWESFQWTGCGFEVLLSVKYDDVSYYDEIERLSNISDIQQVHYDTTNFHKPAFVAMIGYNYSNEYVLVDETTYTLDYVYVQLFEKDDLKILSDINLPINYGECGSVDNFSYSIYDSPSDEQYGY